jgi:hypothetical protein
VTTSLGYGDDVVNGYLSYLATTCARITATIKHCAPFFVRERAGVLRVIDISNTKNPSPSHFLLLPVKAVGAGITNVWATSLRLSFSYPENNPIFINSPSAFTANIVFAQCLEKLNYKWVRGIHGSGLFATEVSV